MSVRINIERKHMSSFIDQQKPRIKNELPIVPLRDTVVFPSSMVPITVGRQKVKLGLDNAWSTDRLVVFVAQKSQICTSILDVFSRLVSYFKEK